MSTDDKPVEYRLARWGSNHSPLDLYGLQSRVGQEWRDRKTTDGDVELGIKSKMEAECYALNRVAEYRVNKTQPETDGENTVNSKALTFPRLRQANATRAKEWTKGHESDDLAFRTLELFGECGELVNVIKKLSRSGMNAAGALTPDAAKKQAYNELADVVICVDRVAERLDIDLGGLLAATMGPANVLPTRSYRVCAWLDLETEDVVHGVQILRGRNWLNVTVDGVPLMGTVKEMVTECERLNNASAYGHFSFANLRAGYVYTNDESIKTTALRLAAQVSRFTQDTESYLHLGNRNIVGIPSTFKSKASRTLVRIITLVDTMAQRLNINLGDAVCNKFNVTSDKMGLSTRLCAR